MTCNILDICHINIRSLNGEKIDALKADIVSSYDVICLTETHLPNSTSDLSLPGFQNILCKNRTGKTGGGVAVYASDQIGITRKADLEIPGLELMWVRIKAGLNIFLLGVCYRPPNAKADFWQQLQDSVDLAKQTGIKNILLTGDFNADLPTPEGHNLKDFTDSNNFDHHIKSPTRLTLTTYDIKKKC